jgi:hypothetical protein
VQDISVQQVVRELEVAELVDREIPCDARLERAREGARKIRQEEPGFATTAPGRRTLARLNDEVVRCVTSGRLRGTERSARRRSARVATRRAYQGSCGRARLA